jgi:hypothetical protein
MDNIGEVQTFNAAKDIATHRDLPLVLNLMNAMRQARTGETPKKSLYDMGDNERIFNQVRGLSLIIAALRDLIQLGRSRIRHKSENIEWYKLYKTIEEKKLNPFELFECDYNNLMKLKDKLEFCEMYIKKADRTPNFEDDLLLKKQTNDGEIFELTENFYELFEELENLQEELESILNRNAILNQGIFEDEVLTHEQLAEEAKKRITES